MMITHFYYHLFIFLLSLLFLLPTYYAVYKKLLFLILPETKNLPLQLSLTIFFANTFFSVVITGMVGLKILNQITALFCLLPGIIFTLMDFYNIKNLRPKITPFRIIYFLIISIFIIACALPETSWDALAYHLKTSFPVSFNYTSTFYEVIPKGLDVLFWYGQVLTQETSLCHFIHFSYLLSLSMFFYHTIDLYFSKYLARLFSLLVFFFPYTTRLSVSSYVDVGSACAEVIMVISAINFLKDQNRYDLRLFFLSIGSALSIKYTSLSLIFVTSIIFLITLAISKKLTFFLRSVDLISIFLLFSPFVFWYGKNLLLYRNPIWPFYFGHDGMDVLTYKQLTLDNLSNYAFTKSLVNYFLLPFRFFLYRFQSYHLNGFSIFQLTSLKGLDPFIFLFLAGFIISMIKKNYQMIQLGIIIILNLTLVFYAGSHQYRYLLGTLFLFLIMTACFFHYYSHYKKQITFFFITTLTGFYFFGGLFDLCKRNYFALTHPSRLNDYLEKYIHDFDLVNLMNAKHIPGEKSTYCFTPLAFFYLSHQATSLNNFLPSTTSTNSNAELKNYLKQNGIDYFLIHEDNSLQNINAISNQKWMDEGQKQKIKTCLKFESYLKKTFFPAYQRRKASIYLL